MTVSRIGKHFPRLRGFLAILLGAALTGCLQADTLILHLKNGDRLSGRLISTNNSRVRIDAPALGKVSVPVDAIEKRELIPGAGPAVKPEAKPSTTASKQVDKSGANAGVAVVAAAKPDEPKAPKRWIFDLQLGVNLQYSQRESQLYYGRFTAGYAKDRFRHVFDYKVDYGETENTVNADKMDATSKLDFDLNPKLFLYNLAGVGYDHVRLIDFQFEEGPGLGYRFIKRPTFALDGEVGASFLEQHLASGLTTDRFFFRISDRVFWKVNEKFTLDERLEYFQDVSDLSGYRLRFETSLRYSLTKYMTLNLTLLDLYESQPAPGVSNNDLQIRSALGLRF